MKKFALLFITTIVLFTGVIVLSGFVSGKLSDYKSKEVEISEQLNFENRILNAWEWIPFTNVGDEMVATWQELETKAKADYNGALVYGLFLVILVAVYIGVNVLVYRNTDQNYQAYGLIMVFAALSFLYLGLTAPLIEIMAYSKDLTFDVPLPEIPGFGTFGIDAGDYNLDRTLEGRTYYFYQNKSIIELIHILYTGGNFLIALVVLFFSVVFPVFKLIMSVVILLSPQKRKSLRYYKIVKNLGKWSMADVFLCSVFLSIFSFSNMEVGVDLGASTLAGTYFFLIFVAISIASGKYLKLAMKKVQDISEWEV